MERSDLDGALLERLGGTFLFRATPPGLMEAVLLDRRCFRARVRKGRTIYTPEDFRRCLGLLVSGTVQVSKENLIVSVLGPGELFGAAALFNDEEAYVTTLTARSDCDLVFFPQSLVEDLMSSCPAVARSYISYLSGRIRFLNGKIQGLIAPTAERKLEQYLAAHVRDDWVELDCPATGLAKRLNVSRASLYRAFDALEAAGAIRREWKRIRILDGEALRHEALE